MKFLRLSAVFFKKQSNKNSEKGQNGTFVRLITNLRQLDLLRKQTVSLFSY